MEEPEIEIPRIDHNHPLYLRESDTPGVALIDIKFTGPENYGINALLSNAFDCDWILDSGASYHITFHKEIMHDIKDCSSHNNSGVQVPTGNKCKVTHIGSVSILDNEVLKDVLHVPDFKFNLLYVSKLTKEMSCIAMFFPDFCVLQGLYNGKVMGIGKVMWTVPFADEINTYSSNSTNNSALWHMRLGHPSIKSRLKFPSSSNNAISIFQLIHIDVCGPHRIPTYGRKHYFVTVVDDYRKSPHVLLYNKPPDINHLKLFDYLCYASNLPKGDKFSPRVNRSILVGYSTTQKGYKLYDLKRKVFLVSRDMSFREDVFSFKNAALDSGDLFLKQLELVAQSTQPSIEQESASQLGDDDAQEQVTHVESASQLDDDDAQEQGTHTEILPEAHENHIAISPDAISRETLTPVADTSQDSLNDTTIPPQPSETSTQQPSVHKIAHNVRKGGRISKAPIWLKDYAFSACIEPNSFKEAVQDDRWVEAMHQEIQALEDNKTWELVDLPIGKQAI
ncbi:uncharacterized protein LOC142176373 [Nicotiana tabacum]|uniref:Uncharacterized protein LOC142176373 n=1 Tax=Nicotiana tabacum TaxID=4097 RepID=A0AC58TRN6_TOBAC